MRARSEALKIQIKGEPRNVPTSFISLRNAGAGQFKAVAPIGAPFDIVLPITGTNGSISGATTGTISAGSMESDTLTVTRTAGITAAVTVNIGTLPSLPSGHDGYALVKSTDLPLTVINARSVVTSYVPTFTDGGSTTRSIAENTAASVNIGTAIAATDGDNDTLTYTLGGTDATSFSIISTSGQLQTKAALDYETKTSYSVTVSVSDGSGGTDSITVTINVTDVDERTINPPLSERTQQVRDAIVAAAGVNSAADVTVAHLAAITTLNLSEKSISSLKAGDFSGLTSLIFLYLYDNFISDISALENLTALKSLNLGANSISDISALENLTSLEWLGLRYNSISDISALENLTSLEQLDLQHNSISNISALGNLTALTSLNLNENYTISDISVLENLTSLVYLKLEQNSISDVSVLEDLTSLEDLDLKNNLISDYGPLRRLKAAKPNVNIDIDINNNPPVFSEGASTTRSITENTISWQNIGAPVPATDADNDTLVYLLRGTDAAAFQVGLKTGQLRNRASMDYETKNTYSVTIIVKDGNGGGDSIDVTINVTDVPETNSAPTFTDGTTATRTIAENTAANTNIGTAIAATDTNTEDTLTYILSGTDASSFAINRNTGQLRTKAALNYETKTTYTVTITVSDGSLTDTISVTVNITDVDEEPAGTPRDDTLPPTTDTRTAFEANMPAGYTRVTLNDTGDVWGIPTKYTSAPSSSDVGTVAYMVIAKLMGCSFADAEVARQSKVYIKTESLGKLNNFTSEAVCGMTSSTWQSSWNAARITHLRFFDETSLPNIKEAVYNAATDQIEIPGVWQPPQDTGAPQQPVDTGSPPTPTTSTTVPLTEATLNGGIVTLSIDDQTYEASVFRIKNAVSVTGIPGVTVDSVERVSDMVIAVELAFNGNIDTDTTLTFTVDSGAIVDYTGPEFTAQTTIPAVTESVVASVEAPLTGATLDEGIVPLTLSGRKFEQSNFDIRGAVSVTGITGVTVRSFDIDRQSDTEVTVELTFNGNLNADGTLTFTIGPDAIAGYNGPALTAQVSVSASTDAPADTGNQNPDPPETPQQPGNQDPPQQPANTGGTPTLRVSTAAPLTEAMLHGGVVTLTLSNDTFERSMFWIRNAISVSGITGVGVESFGGERISDTQATIELEYDGNMAVNGTLTISLEADGIKDYDGATLTAQIQVTAVAKSVAASTAAPLKEATLDGSVVPLTLSGAKYESFIFDIRGNVAVSGIAGVTIPWHQPKRKSDTQITVELEFDGDMTTNGTLTFTVDAEAIAGYSGHALTGQVTVTADRENALLANFPNPFNPETWIPYHLAKPAEVTITIYAINSQVVRRLVLGHQPAGIYQNRSRAAHWDGKNTFGESVASGVYFYTLSTESTRDSVTAGDFTTTRKMLIRK